MRVSLGTCCDSWEELPCPSCACRVWSWRWLFFLSCLSFSQLECFPSSFLFVSLCPCTPKKSVGGIKKVIRSLVQRQHERDFQSPLRGALPCPGLGSHASVAVMALMGRGTRAALPDEEHSSTRCFLLFYFYFLGQNMPPGSTPCPTPDALLLPSPILFTEAGQGHKEKAPILGADDTACQPVRLWSRW